MAISANCTWEVRTTGNDTNGGFFVTGASGTDYSQQTGPQVTFDGVTISGTTVAVSTVITVVGYTVAATDIGNCLNITGGTNFTTGRYEITAANTGTNAWTVDRNCCTAAAAAMTGRMGGCLATIDTAASAVASSNKCWVQSGTYSSGALTFAAASVTPSSTVHPTMMIGYASARGDIFPGSGNNSSRPLLLNTGTSTKITLAHDGWWLLNLVIGKTGGSTMSIGISTGGQGVVLENCAVTDFNTTGFSMNTNTLIHFCEVSNGSGASAIGIRVDSLSVIADNYVHDITGGATASCGIRALNDNVVVNNIVDTISGSVSDGIQVDQFNSILSNSIYNCGRDAIRITSGALGTNSIKNNICVTNAGYGLNMASGSWPANWRWDGNAYYNNTLGTRNGIDSVTATYASGAYTNTYDKILTGDPFTNSAGADFTLNNTSGAGLACRATGWPNSYPGLTTTGYRDVGAVQNAGATTGVALLFTPGV